MAKAMIPLEELEAAYGAAAEVQEGCDDLFGHCGCDCPINGGDLVEQIADLINRYRTKGA